MKLVSMIDTPFGHSLDLTYRDHRDLMKVTDEIIDLVGDKVQVMTNVDHVKFEIDEALYEEKVGYL